MSRSNRLRHAARHSRRFDHGEPLRWLNLVPLAGVLGIAAALVLTSYVIRPHALIVDLPMSYDSDDMLGPLTPNVNRLIVLDNGALLWNAEPIFDRDLGKILDLQARLSPKPALLFTPEATAPYARVFEVMAIIRAHGALDQCFRFSGIARYRSYERPETFEDLVLATREDCPPATATTPFRLNPG